MKRISKWIILAGLMGIAIALVVGCAPRVHPELEQARSALQQAKEAEAPDFCPEIYKSAELKLKQAELLFDDNQKEKAVEAANGSINASKAAKDCAVNKKAGLPGPTKITKPEPPKELKEFKVTIYFDFNSNAIRPDQFQTLANATGQLLEFAKKNEFTVVLTAHADPPGTERENMEITMRRAAVVRYFMIDAGVPAAMIKGIAMGETLSSKTVEATGDLSAYRFDYDTGKYYYNNQPILYSKIPVAGTTEKQVAKKNPLFRRVDITVTDTKPKELVKSE